MSLRDRIEQAKAEGTRIRTDRDFVEKTYKTEEERLAREQAKLQAKEILAGLPSLIAERAEQGKSTSFEVCDVGSINTIEELRRNFRHAGSYVLDALEKEGYTLTIGIDCSGNWTSHNSLMCSF